jgi:hypothetical protein
MNIHKQTDRQTNKQTYKKQGISWIQISAAMQKRFALFCHIMQRGVIIPYWRFGRNLTALPSEYGTESSSRNVGMQLPLHTA